MAEKRERSTGIGFVVGFFCGIFGVIGYAIAGDSQDKKNRKEKEHIQEIAKAIKDQ